MYDSKTLSWTVNSIYTRLTASIEGHLKSRKCSTDCVQCFTAFDWHSSKPLTKTIYKHGQGNHAQQKLGFPRGEIKYVRPSIKKPHPDMIIQVLFHLSFYHLTAKVLMLTAQCKVVKVLHIFIHNQIKKKHMLVFYKYLKK